MNQRSRVIPTPAQEQAALAWLSLLHDQPSSGDQATFSQWLQADPAHVEAYAQAQVLWELSEQPARTLADEDALALQGLLRAMDGARARARRRWSAGLAMAASVLLVIALGAGWQPGRWLDDLGADYVFRAGQVRTVILADQSQVTLDADSAIAVDFSHGERHVQLRRGAGFFSVSHTGAPFVVAAGEGEARVLAPSSKCVCKPTVPRSRCCPGVSRSPPPKARRSRCSVPASRWRTVMARRPRCRVSTAKRNWPGARVG